MKRFFLFLLIVLFCILIFPLLTTYGEPVHTFLATTLTTPVPSPQVSQRQASPIVGAPTISSAKINQLLCATYSGKRSTACGTGNDLYALGVKYGIDPAYATAFFKHESTFGTQGWAVQTLSLGNIRCTPGYQCKGGFRAYGNWQEGYEDWYRLILYGYVEGQVSARCPCLTIAQIIPVYAPQADGNNEQGYIQDVESSVKRWQQESQDELATHERK